MAYFVLQEIGKNIMISQEPIIISVEWLKTLGVRCKGVEAAHARIVKTDAGFVLESLAGETVVNGTKVEVGSSTKLEHNAVMIFGTQKFGCIAIFKDEQQAQRRMDTRRIRALGADLINKKNVAEKLSREFFNKMPRSLSAFCKFFLEFLEQNFHINRGVIYRIENKKWIPVVAKAPQNFVPPRYILDQVWENKEAKRFNMTEVDDVADLSRSIVENKIYSAICFPLFHADTMQGVLYVDTLEDKDNLTQDDLLLLSAIIPGIEGVFSVLLYQENLRQQASQLLLSFQRFDMSPTLSCSSFDKSLQSFSITKRGVDNSDIIIFCSFTKETGGDYTAQLILFSGLLALFETADLIFASGAEFLQKLDLCWAVSLRTKFHCSVGFVSILNSDISFVGLESSSLVLKTKEKPASFCSSAGSKWGSSLQEKRNATIIFSSILTDETILILSSTDPQELMLLFEKKKLPIDFKELLLKNSGGLVCKWKSLQK